MLTPKETDRVFYDSPDAGHPTCMCSRCGNQIRETEVPIRIWPTGSSTEYRYCEKCCEAAGVVFPDPADMVENAGPNREPDWHRKTIQQQKIDAGEHILDEGYNKELTTEHDPDIDAPSIYDEEFPDPDPPYTKCKECGRTTGIECERYIGISEDGYCTICVARMQDDGITYNP